MNNYMDNLLRTDAPNCPVDRINIGAYYWGKPAAASTTKIMAAAARVETTAWVASSCTVKAASDNADTLTVKAPTMLGDLPNRLSINLLTAGDDVLAVSADGAEITIELAKTTATNNTAAKIQVKIRALEQVDGIPTDEFACTAGGSWDSAAIATGETDAVDFDNGVTGDYDVYDAEDLDAQPDCVRNITATAGGTSGDIANVAVTVIGTDINNNKVTEQLPYFTADTAGTVVGDRAFKTITQVLVPAHDGAAATTAIGIGVKLGVPFKMSGKVIKTWFNGAEETTAATVAANDELSLNTIQPHNHASLDGAKDMRVYFIL